METFKLILSVAAILSSAACMILLFRGYLRKRVRLLLWSAVCFTGLTVNNILLLLDLVVFPNIDFRPFRLAAALLGMLALLYGFIFDSD